MDATATSRRIRREADTAERLEPRARFRRGPVAAQAPAADELIAQTVTRARDGDADALRLLYLWYANGVYSYVCSILTDEHAAEDVTQSVFARLQVRLQRYELRAAPFGAWIIRVARNAAIDYMRAQRAVPQEEVRDPGAAQETSSGDTLEALREALATLPEDQREVLTLRFIVGLSLSEIGQRLGRSEPSVNALQHRGRLRLREELTRRGAAPAVRTG